MSNYGDEETRQYADLFRALSNPHRLHIFLYLASSCFPGQMSTSVEMRTSVGDLADGLDISPSTVSHHIRELRQTGLIRMERRGKNVDCWVEPETLASLARFFQEAGGN